MPDAKASQDSDTAAKASPLIGVDLHGTGIHPSAWRRVDSQAEDVFSARYWTGLLASLDRSGADLAFIGDSFALAEHGDAVQRGRLDAVSIAARATTATHRIGLVPTVTVTHTEPFHVSKAIASLDHTTLGRAGWQVAVSEGATQARLFGRKDAQDTADLWAEAEEAIEVVTRLWDSWEDDAEIRDLDSGRFVDRDKLHYIDFVGTYFSVKGPSITPRPPQGHPLVVVSVDDAESLRLAAARADVVRVSALDAATARERSEQVRAAAVEAGRRADDVRILLDVEVLTAADADVAERDLAELEQWADARYAPESLLYVGDTDGLVDLIDTVTGSPTGEAGHLDGVTVRPLALASAVALLADRVLPRLRRDVSATEPTPPDATALRRRLGVVRPANLFVEQALRGTGPTT
ncbi:LLM class flavin-dependent oxidoreductase [Rhodococcus triatomae]|uniref:Flavin-dependent oxidoreductase, luciferase family (Includes alkanesulfonate monooxygenase SsuD and methylene tetrahydromethanopterin reductase) n=1 Tax=Rhodococcus triatomae TaxID=300028 RepID=A0A1G8NI28_9NOCA|nr:LLM class flavin-dependent oxidoreductase [Rhodococcus triatomae]QNG20010.1 LLM class flavin-dependent oxidoreductase [Rhodococcus triatomae]QNG24074.1 LLM class flavin-dependent oxidoreductase [Rhodococcus triatomae]SDI79802.1 Flavin-dependent oxidoreductase, luciferase family (includes alkanesulfonate monooxygenase SsuD and methylene tetrahydromethanopterin reductase) [Rhodococcus triatomae]